jgi:polysaccharide lyase-like protein/Big-like domain-containing protein
MKFLLARTQRVGLGGSLRSSQAQRLLLATLSLMVMALGIASTADARSLAIKRPRAGSTVAGKTRFTAKVAGHPRSVAFYVDGRHRWTDRSKPFAFGRHGRLDASHFSRGSHHLMIEARYRNGRGSRSSIEVHVVRGHASATTPPTVSWKAPTSGQTVRGLLSGSTCEAKASDTDMYQVRFSLDGREVRVESNAPYNCVWDTMKSSDGTHTLKAVAVDKAGNKSTASINVKVANKSQATSSSTPPSASTPAPSPSSTGSLLWSGDFETGSFSQWEGVLQAVPGRASIVTSPRIEGNYAARLEARAGEFIGSDASPVPGRNRTELVASPLANRHNPKDGDEYWYRWYFYLPSETPLPLDGTNQAMTILQWTTAASGSTPGWEQLGIFQFRDTKASADPGPGHVELLYTDSGSRDDGTEHFWRKAATAVTRNAWHKLLIHKRWSSKSDGFIEIWYDDVKQTLTDGTTKMNMRTLTPGYSARMQHGIYRGNAIGGNAVLYSDGFRIGTSREAVGG